ncbi:MAG: hypothetical protein ACYDBB_18790 [Armatimonadota bacterium]
MSEPRIDQPNPTPRRRGSSVWVVLTMLLLGGVLGATVWCIQQGVIPGGSFNGARRPAPVPSPTPTPTPVIEKIDDVTGLTADAVVKLGSNEYLQRYTAKTGDESEVGQDNACVAYAQFKSADNDRRAEALTARQQLMVAQTRKVLQQWEETVLEITEEVAGGGTMYSHAGVRAAASREDLLGQVITGMKKPVAKPQVRRVTATTLDDIRQKVKDLANATFDPASGSEWKKEFTASYPKLKAQLPKLQKTIKALPDEPAYQVAGYANDAFSYIDEMGE